MTWGESKVSFYVYIMASKRNGTLYIGSTDSLTRRAWEHRESLRPGFTKKYGVHMLFWYEVCDTREGAKLMERRMKEWRRSWKLRLIEERNPEWVDLYETLNS